MKLLSSVSAAALLASIYAADRALAADSDRPVLWIEGGWHFEKLGQQGEIFAPSFLPALVSDGFNSVITAQKAQSYSYGADGNISFEPEGSDWIFSAAVRYGRSHSRKHDHQQTPGAPLHVQLGHFVSGTITPSGRKFSDTGASNSETHSIIDFRAGKDLGLGLFGGTSQIGFGIRFAQFRSQSSAHINADPDYYFPTNLKYARFHHVYDAQAHNERSFRGLGPSISWEGAAPLSGNLADGEISFDWGVNAALLFGRQKANGHRQTYSHFHYARIGHGKYDTYNQVTASHDRHRMVAVPDAGGFAGLSYRFTDAKLSVGYRADIFFNAMDGGINKRHEINQSFNGPFAMLSIGLSD